MIKKQKEYKLEKVIRKILIELKSKSYVEGVLLFGSCARDIKLKHKDIDLYVLVNEDWYQRKSSYRDSILIELFFNPYGRYLDYFENEENLFTAQMFATGKILFDKGGKMKELKRTAKKNIRSKLTLDRDTVNLIRYHIADANIDIEGELKINKYQALYLMNRAMEMLLKYYFRIKKNPEPKYNYIIKKVEKNNQDLYVQIKNFFEETNPNLKFDILINIEKIVLKSIGKPKLSWISSKRYYPHVGRT